MARLINLIREDHFPVVLDYEFCLDVRWWITFMRVFNGVSLIKDSPWSLPDAVLSTDACLSGGGGFYEGHFFHSSFPDFVRQSAHSINILELMTLAVALKLWAHYFPRQRIVVACDNTQAVAAINTGRASAPVAQRINRICDHLSRWHLSASHRDAFSDLAAGYELRYHTVSDDLFCFDAEHDFHR